MNSVLLLYYFKLTILFFHPNMAEEKKQSDRFAKVAELAPFDPNGDIDSLHVNQVLTRIIGGRKLRGNQRKIIHGVLQKFNGDIVKTVEFIDRYAFPFQVPTDLETLTAENMTLKKLLWQFQDAIENPDESHHASDDLHEQENSKYCVYIGNHDLYTHFCELPWNQLVKVLAKKESF